MSAAVAAGATDPAFAHRVASATLMLSDHSGAPLAGREIILEQTRHAFGFGNIGFDLVGLANDFGGASDGLERLAEQWLELFNIATLPFYWSRFEPVEGEPATEKLRRAAEWFVARGVPVKGHPLLWHTLAPKWLLGRSLEQVEAAARARIRRDVRDFAGLIDLWDAINEVVIMPVFVKEDNVITELAKLKGRVEMVRLAFETAREANPVARLVLNDFDLSIDYEHLIEECLTTGIRIDALGLQTHMHQGYRGEDEMLSTVDRFARYGLPIQMTETTLVSGDLMPAHIVDLNDYQVPSWPSTVEGEQRQADEVARHYRSLVAHPAVESICYWGIADAGAWLGAPAGLVRLDGSVKPSYTRLHELIKGDWWLPPTTVRTDESGRVDVCTFAGELRVSAGGASASVTLPAGPSEQPVTLSA